MGQINKRIFPKNKCILFSHHEKKMSAGTSIWKCCDFSINSAQSYHVVWIMRRDYILTTREIWLELIKKRNKEHKQWWIKGKKTKEGRNLSIRVSPSRPPDDNDVLLLGPGLLFFLPWTYPSMYPYRCIEFLMSESSVQRHFCKRGTK